MISKGCVFDLQFCHVTKELSDCCPNSMLTKFKPAREETVERKGSVGLSIQIPGDKADLSCFSPTPAEHPKNMARTERSSRKQMALRHAITARLSVAQESIVAPVVIVLSTTSTIDGSIWQLLHLVKIFYPSHSVPQISDG